jgi:hypothetical protein
MTSKQEEKRKEDDLKKNGRRPKKIIKIKQNQPNWL